MWDKIVSFERLIFEEIEFKNSSIASFVITFYFYTHCSIFRFEVEKSIDPIFKFDSFEKIKSRANKFSSFFFFFLISICFYRRIIRNIRAQSSKCKINEIREITFRSKKKLK